MNGKQRCGSIAGGRSNDALPVLLSCLVSCFRYWASAERLDLGTMAFHRVADMAEKRTGLGVCSGPDGGVYAVGGSPDGSKAHRSAERFDPRTGSWELLPRMALGRGYCSASFGASG